MKFCLLDKKEYADFESKNPYGNCMQMVERAELREKMGFHCFLTGVKEGDEVLAAGLLVEKNGEVWVQIGPILDWQNVKLAKFFIEGCVKFCLEHKFCEIEIFPPVLLSVRSDKGEVLKKFDQKKIFSMFEGCGFEHMGLTMGTELKALRWMFVKDLSSFKNMREAELSFAARRRSTWHQAEKKLEIHVLKDKSELQEWILPLQDSNARNGLKTRDLKYFEDMWESHGDKVMFVEARKKEDSEVVASELFFLTKNEVVSFLTGITEKYKKENGATMIKGGIIEECLKRGWKRLNFYGVEPDFSGNNPLLFFKGSFGGVVEEYIGGFRRVLSPARYYFGRLMRKMRGILKR